MTNTKLIKFFVFVLLLNLTIPIVLLYGNQITNSNDIDYYNEIENLRTQSFSMDDYTAILNSQDQGLGNITINNMTFNDIELGFYLYNSKWSQCFRN